MTRAKFLTTLIITLVPVLGSTPALAGGWHGHHHHSSVSFGFVFGPGFYYPPPYYYPPVVVAPAPVYYIEQSRAAPEQGYWYYCNDTKTYYPYVQQCGSPWARVTPQIPPPNQ